MAPPLLPLHADPGNQPLPLTPDRLLTAWTFEPWVLAALVLRVGLYLWGVRRLAVRGIAWLLGRTLAWCVGAAGTLAVALTSVVGSYDTVLFSGPRPSARSRIRTSPAASSGAPATSPPQSS